MYGSMRRVHRLVSIAQGSFHGRILQRSQVPCFFQSRMITERSFAAEHLKSNGVKLDAAPEEPPFEVNEDMVNHPNERVQKLLNGFMELNILEVAMFMKAMQVTLVPKSNWRIKHIVQKNLGISDEMMSGPVRGSGGDSEGPAAEAAPVVEEKTAFEIKLKGFDAKAKIKIIKEVRAITGLGLKEVSRLA